MTSHHMLRDIRFDPIDDVVVGKQRCLSVSSRPQL